MPPANTDTRTYRNDFGPDTGPYRNELDTDTWLYRNGISPAGSGRPGSGRGRPLARHRKPPSRRLRRAATATAIVLAGGGAAVGLLYATGPQPVLTGAADQNAHAVTSAPGPGGPRRPRPWQPRPRPGCPPRPTCPGTPPRAGSTPPCREDRHRDRAHHADGRPLPSPSPPHAPPSSSSPSPSPQLRGLSSRTSPGLPHPAFRPRPPRRPPPPRLLPRRSRQAARPAPTRRSRRRPISAARRWARTRSPTHVERGGGGISQTLSACSSSNWSSTRTSPTMTAA